MAAVVTTAVRLDQVWPMLHERFVQPVWDHCQPPQGLAEEDEYDDYVMQLEIENQRLHQREAHLEAENRSLRERLSVDPDEYIVGLEVENNRLRELIRVMRLEFARIQPRAADMRPGGDGWQRIHTD